MEVVLGWHVVTHVPVGLPLAKEWESKLNVKVYSVFFSLSVRGADVADVVVIVETMDIVRQGGVDACDCVGTVVWVDVWLVVYS